MKDFERGERIGMGVFFFATMAASVVKGLRGPQVKAGPTPKVQSVPKAKPTKIPKHKYVPGKSKAAKIARRTAKRNANKAKPKVERKIGKRAKEKALNQGKHSFNGLNFNRKSCPIKIPKSAAVTEQIKTGYTQVKFVWMEAGKKFEARWHTRTPGAPATQGDTWVVTRRTPSAIVGVPGVDHVLVGNNTWVRMIDWSNAGLANRSGVASPAQELILQNGHHPAY
jgi:hypothetical protein